jgi:drug/metabolite transporter (DMT)-like permease
MSEQDQIVERSHTGVDPLLKQRSGRWLPFAQSAFLSWGIFGFLAKIASRGLSAAEMQVLFLFGTLPLMVSALLRARTNTSRDAKGVVYALLTGVVASLGNVSYFAALRRGPASVISPATALYPLVSVALAAIVLREKVNRLQRAGIGLALVAIVLLSI